jgi:hypothetical protein
MNIEANFAGREVGYDVPAIPGMSEDGIQTPCLILDLDALERNIRKMDDVDCHSDTVNWYISSGGALVRPNPQSALAGGAFGLPKS